MNELLNGTAYFDVVYAATRVATGTFFAISGVHKLFWRERHESLVRTLTDDGIPFPFVCCWLVPLGELTWGFSLAIGLATPFMATGLFIICYVATMVDGVKRIPTYKPIDRADWLDDLLYLPEVLYLLLLALFITGGAGPFSVDAFLMEMAK